MKLRNKILKTLILSMLVAQAPAHADLWSSISSKCTQLWKAHKAVIGLSMGLAGIIAFAWGYKRHNASQRKLNNRISNRLQSQTAAEKLVTYEGNFTPSTQLTIKGICGNIAVQGRDQDTISIRAVKTATCLAALRNTEVEFSNNYQEIHTRHRTDYESCRCTSGVFHPHANGQRSHQSAVDYTIQVPHSTCIDAQTDKGNINIT